MQTKLHFNILLILLTFGIGYVSLMEAQTDLNIQTTYQGFSRSFRVHIPQGYSPSQPIPAVLVFHAGGVSNSLEIQTRTAFHLVGDTANFITIFPQALFGFWADSRGTPADVAGINDIGFTSFILDTLETLYSIDPTRIYAAGMSTGGVFCQRLALQLNERIAAFASVGASLYTSLMAYFPPARKIPVLFMNGTSDLRNPYYGGAGLSGYSTAVNTDTSAFLWATFDNCYPLPAIYEFPDINATDLSTVTKISYDPCQSCSEVILYRVNNGGHTWPGGIGQLPILGNTNQDINASHEIWSFFRRHQLQCHGVDAGDNIMDIVEKLDLNSGVENSLLVKIENAVTSCEDGNETDAMNQLNAFINQVNALRGNNLTDAEADHLIAFAQDLISSIQDGTAGCGMSLPIANLSTGGYSSQTEWMTDKGREPFGRKELEPGMSDESNHANSSLTVFPNPAASEITISCDSENEFSVEILDMMGILFLRMSNQNTIDVSALPDGMYLLKASGRQNFFLQKIIIEHSK